MAKSKIIKELANGEINTLTALKRAKVLLSELGNTDISNWVNYEIIGYPDTVELPVYRKTIGTLFGSYFKGSMAMHITYKNVPIPLGNMPKKIQSKLLEVEFVDGVETLKKIYDAGQGKNSHLVKSVPADCYPLLCKFNNDPFMNFTSVYVEFSSEKINNVFSSVENKLLDVLMLLEKEFGILDNLDIDVDNTAPEKVAEIADKIRVIIYNDNSIHIGDNNKIKDSDIAVNT